MHTTTDTKSIVFFLYYVLAISYVYLFSLFSLLFPMSVCSSCSPYYSYVHLFSWFWFLCFPWFWAFGGCTCPVSLLVGLVDGCSCSVHLLKKKKKFCCAFVELVLVLFQLIHVIFAVFYCSLFCSSFLICCFPMFLFCWSCSFLVYIS